MYPLPKISKHFITNEPHVISPLTPLCGRRGGSHNICGQKEAEQESRGERLLGQLLGGDPGGPAPAGRLLLHRQREHPAQAAPHPDRLHRHQGRVRR